jgi:hypothetical protein
VNTALLPGFGVKWDAGAVDSKDVPAVVIILINPNE